VVAAASRLPGKKSTVGNNMKQKIILLAPSLDPMSDFVTGLANQPDVRVTMVSTPEEMLRLVREESPNLVVLDENIEERNGLDLVIRILSINAMVNTAMITSMSPEAWHEKSEGLGMLEPVPDPPSAADARNLLRTLEKLGNFA